MKRFTVVVSFQDDQGAISMLGAPVVVAAKDKQDARRQAMDLLWDSRLDSASCTPIVTVTDN